MRKLLALTLLLGQALAEIGAPVEGFFQRLGRPPAEGEPVALERGHVRVEVLDGLLYRVRYAGPLDAVEEAAGVIAAAVGDDRIRDPFRAWYRRNRQAIAERGTPVRVKLGPGYLMAIEIGKELRFLVAPWEVPESAFGEPRHVLGSKGPLVREYSDFYCPYCQRLARTVLPVLKENYVEKGVFRFEYRHFPLVGIHPDAFRAAEASECAAGQGKFWPYHDRLFAELQKRKEADYVALAEELGLEVGAFESCLEGGKYRDVVRAMRAEAEALGLEGTPSVFVGPFRLPNPFDPEAYARYARMAEALSQKGK